MSIRTPFKPHYGSNQSVTVTATPQNLSLTKTDKSVRIINSGTAIGYFRIGESDVANASTIDCPVYPGGSLVVEKGIDHTTISVVSGTSTQFEIMTGEGGY